MVLKGIFGGRAPYTHTQHYEHNPSEAWMEQEQQRLIGIAEDLGIDFQLVRQGNEVHLGFGNVKDAAMLRLRAFGNDYNPGKHVHLENFVEGDELYRDAYLVHAQAAINELGLSCRIEQKGNQVAFRFDTSGDHAIYTEMRDRGVFHQLAMQDIGGPTAQP